MIWLITIVVGIITTLWLYFEYPVRKNKQLLASIPGPPILPIVGNLLDLRGGVDLLQYFNTQREKYGKVYKMQFAGRLSIICSDPKDIEVILRHPENIDKPKSTTTFLSPWLGNGLLLDTGAHWKEMRKTITPSFHFNILEKFFLVFNEHSDVLMNILREKGKGNINIFPLLQLFALDVICETAMGTKIHAQTKLVGNDYVEAVQEMERIISVRGTKLLQSVPLIFKFTALGREHDRYLKVLKTSSYKIIQKRRNEILEAGNKATDDDESVGKKRMAFLDLLLQARHSNGEPLTNQEISDEVDTFMFAGHDTTSTQMSFLLYLLARNPEAQEEIYKEQQEILEDLDRTPTFSEIQNMQYLERAIKESQRLYGSVPSFARAVTHDITLSNGVTIPKNVTFSVFASQVHRDPEIYPEPEKFDPDRFLPEKVRERSPYAFIPFSAGPRNCIGQKFAMLEMKTCISNLVRNFKVLPAYEANGSLWEPKLKLILLLSTSNGVQIRLEPRKK